MTTPAYPDWRTLPGRYMEQIARTRLVEAARNIFDLQPPIPEDGAVDAAITEAILSIGGPSGVGHAARATAVQAFDTTAARDAAIPAPTGNELAWNRQTGYQERYDVATTQWLPEGVTGTAGPIVRTRSKGGRGTGTVNDAPAIIAADNAVATAGFQEMDPGAYRVDGSLTTVHALHPLPGALIRPAAGVTVTVAGPLA